MYDVIYGGAGLVPCAPPHVHTGPDLSPFPRAALFQNLLCLHALVVGNGEMRLRNWRLGVKMHSHVIRPVWGIIRLELKGWKVSWKRPLGDEGEKLSLAATEKGKRLG